MVLNHALALQNALLRSGGNRRHNYSPDEKTVQHFGHALFNALFTGVIHNNYVVSQREAYQQGKGLRLKLRIQSPELAALPWEFLYDPDQDEYICLSNNTPIVRYIEAPYPPQPLNVVPPLRILGMIATPKDLIGLDVDIEKQRVERATEELRAKGLVELTWIAGQTWHDLQRAMQAGPWHIFHFIGHGSFDPHTEEGLIALLETSGNSNYLSATSLGRLLADHRSLRLVVLNTCEGARGSRQDIFSSTSATLVRRGIPAVLAMQYEITDRAAIELSRAFYEALANGLPVDMAVSEARKAISLGIVHTVEWGTPVLYMCSANGILFDMIQKPDTIEILPVKPVPSSEKQMHTIMADSTRQQISAKSIEPDNQFASPGVTASVPVQQSASSPSVAPKNTVSELPKAVEIFYCYAHQDKRLREKLEVHLSLLKQEGLITGWYDRDIRAGSEWAGEIEAHLNAAHIILLLISPDFMASDYCYSIEMKRALERHEAKEARIIPILLRPTDWERAPFSKLQVLPTDRRPISRWPDRDEAFLNVVRDIRRAVEERNRELATSIPSQYKFSSSINLASITQNKQGGQSDAVPGVPVHAPLQAPLKSVFLFNQPLTESGEFYGRVRERETLFNRTRNGASTSIVGPRRIGKTWLITYLKLVCSMSVKRFRLPHRKNMVDNLS